MILDKRDDVEKCGDGCFSAPQHCRRDRVPPCMINTESSRVRAASSGRLGDVEQTQCPQLSLVMPRACDSAAFNHTQHGSLLLWLRWSPKSARASERERSDCVRGCHGTRLLQASNKATRRGARRRKRDSRGRVAGPGGAAATAPSPFTRATHMYVACAPARTSARLKQIGRQADRQTDG